ncbi:hypothetical protein B0O99DRAFT_595127 [Bisporella sp. PMI_857]|nr:hypothetical protein B0O99DRAFT_595127 [Bisporella sp. PMI_857]
MVLEDDQKENSILNCLHGEKDNSIRPEVVLDINAFCTKAKGTKLKKGAEFNFCSEWQIAKPDDCYGTCIGGCNAMPREIARAGCSTGCSKDCGGGSSGNNHIQWTIRNDGGRKKDISYDECNSQLNWELGGCINGSEQVKNGLWYRWDPQRGKLSKGQEAVSILDYVNRWLKCEVNASTKY